ncbi:NUDIX domain-containing protein [Salinibacter grassmerensis]|uniref:NUDIX domain-containing protein n=1 Tax=Salinibacter grassmerensis TaxID=3040353 RepID=UPI0021E94C37|nr:NUDIX domain-containing protein [Salinibacter grassmerensis]
MPDADPTPVVTVFLRHRGEVLLLHRSENVDSYPGQWGAVTGHIEDDDPPASALREVEEETGLRDADVHPQRQGSAFTVEDDDHGTRWRVHPFLFDVDARSIQTNWETEEVEWVSPTALLRRDTVPDLWTSYRRVAPSILGITNDTTHGSAYLSIRALEVLRDRAGMLAQSEAGTIEDARGRLIGIAHRLLDARPSMAALVNRLHRAMHASLPELPPDAVETNAHEAIQNALAADAAAAETAAAQVGGAHVLTLSRSGTVLSALQSADPSPTVSVAVSAPGEEGVGVAERLTRAGLDVTLLPDAAVARRLQKGAIDAVLVGADTVQPSGAVVNKAGTYGAALAAHHAEVPVYAACAIDKISVDDDTSDESAADRTVYDGSLDVAVRAPRFDTTPPALLTGGLLTDRGTLAPDQVAPIAEELTELRAWT